MLAEEEKSSKPKKRKPAKKGQVMVVSESDEGI
jgi:hypothetical protein